jgi:hypothetical protein
MINVQHSYRATLGLRSVYTRCITGLWQSCEQQAVKILACPMQDNLHDILAGDRGDASPHTLPACRRSIAGRALTLQRKNIAMSALNWREPGAQPCALHSLFQRPMSVIGMFRQSPPHSSWGCALALFGVGDHSDEARVAAQRLEVGVIFHSDRHEWGQTVVNGLPQERQRL